MYRFAPTLVLLVVLFGAPAFAFGDPPGELAFIQALPVIFDGQCVGREVDGQRQQLPCEVRAANGWLWPRGPYYLIIWDVKDRQSMLSITSFSVQGERVLYDREMGGIGKR